MNYLLPPIRKANPLLPLKETTKMRMTSPLGSKLAALEADMAKLEESLLEKKTVRELVNRRAADRRRWPNASPSDDASTLATSPSDGEADNTVADDNAPGPTHRFESMVLMIRDRDNVPMAEAARRARKEFPTLFRDYVKSREGVAKSSYADLVTAEIRKGSSPAVAAAKVAYAYPHAARENIAKRDSGVAEFMSTVTEIMKREGVSRGDGAREAGKSRGVRALPKCLKFRRRSGPLFPLGGLAGPDLPLCAGQRPTGARIFFLA
jgi:hypothetical protein